VQKWRERLRRSDKTLFRYAIAPHRKKGRASAVYLIIHDVPCLRLSSQPIACNPRLSRPGLCGKIFGDKTDYSRQRADRSIWLKYIQKVAR
jgi:hypothetical protein